MGKRERIPVPHSTPPEAGMRIKDRHMWMFFVLPGVILLVLVLGFPAVTSLLYSIKTEDGSQPGFTVSHYSALLKDPFFVRPKKRAVDVPTEVIVRTPLGTSCTYTPGHVFLLGMLPPFQEF